MRSTPARISPETYPIAATATAPAYDYSPPAEVAAWQEQQAAAPSGQQALFSMPSAEPRVIPFDSLTTHAERESIRARAAELARPAPFKTERVEAPRPRVRKTRSTDQRRLEFTSEEQAAALPQSSIVCDAPVAPVRLRLQAGAMDGLLMVIGCGLALGLFRILGGEFALDKRIAVFVALAIVTVPLFYKLLWTVAGRDTFGTRAAGLQLVDFDGNRPSQAQRYQRLCGTVLSFLAAGMGMIWALVDEDGLTWHDHISSTFPAILLEE
ncbi:MAG: RDD family protein [Acidobacteriaceae bacterium]|nr:RDD family protein [Acidobacteriaceae bacterium]